MQLLYATRKGTVLSENIKSGDILQVRLLIRFNTAIADELR